MKRFLVLVLAGVCLSTIAKSQQYEYERPSRGRAPKVYDNNFRFGVFVAPNISWLKPTANKSDDKLYLVSSQGNKLGYSWGLMIDYPFAENYGFSTGFQITSTGGKILATENLNTTQPNTINRVKSADFDYRLQFLELPFALKLRSDELSSGIHVFGQMGLSLGINLSKKASYDVVYTDTMAGQIVEKSVSERNEKIFGSLSIPPAMIALNLGGGIEYPISEKMNFYLGLFFTNNFAPDATNPNRLDLDYKGKFSDGNVRLNNFALRVGLFF